MQVRTTGTRLNPTKAQWIQGLWRRLMVASADSQVGSWVHSGYTMLTGCVPRTLTAMSVEHLNLTPKPPGLSPG